MTSWFKKALSDLGPWPIRSKEISIVFSLFILTAVTVVEMNAPINGVTLNAFEGLAKGLPGAVLTAFVTYITLAISAWITDKNPSHTTAIYFVAALVLAVIMLLTRVVVVTLFNFNVNGQLTAGFPLFWVAVVFYFVINISLGKSNAKLQAQVDHTKFLLDQLEIQRGKIIDAQEQVRKEIATYLHDGLQSQLVVLGLQMRNAAKNMPPEQLAIANSFIEEIEHIRRVDVRKASQQLSPDLQQISVTAAIRDIADRYSPEVKVAIGIDSEIQSPALPERTKLALYRIAEQVILNAAAHGQARNVWLSIAADGDHYNLQIANDGLPLDESQRSGGGSAIISSWVDYLEGTWSLIQVPGQQVLFQAKLKLKPAGA